MPSSRLAACLLAVFMLTGFSLAQNQTAPAPGAPQNPQPVPAEKEVAAAQPATTAQPTATPKPVAPSTPVITIHGYCEPAKTDAPKGKPAACTTVITRAEFETLVDTLQPTMPPQVRRQLATQYPQILFMSQQARKRGLDQTPHYLQLLKFTKLELLKLELDNKLREEADKVSDSDIADYYKKNSNNFDQSTFLRVFVPRTRQSDIPKDASPADAEAARKNSEAQMTKVAADLRARAAAGDDFEKLQRDAYEAAGARATPPSTLNAHVRRGNLPAAQSAIFDLNPGDVSGVLDDPTGFYFFKVVSKTTSSLADVKEDIRNTLRNQREQALHQAIENAVTADLNKEYFPDTRTPPPPTHTGPRPMTSSGPRPASPLPTQPKE